MIFKIAIDHAAASETRQKDASASEMVKSAIFMATIINAISFQLP